MEQKQNERYIIFASEELQLVSEEFADEIERRPSSAELCEILTWALRSSHDDVLLDIHPRAILALKPIVKKGNKRIDSEMNAAETESSVVDLNDNIFVVANTFLWDLTNKIKADTGQAPTLDSLCSILVEGLHRCDENVLIDSSPRNILGIKAEVRKGPKIICKVGDIVALPAKNSEYFIAVVLAKNRFGVAYGFFEGTSKLKGVSMASLPPVKRHPLYCDDEFIANSRWEIIGHNEALLALFPVEPEIYHRSQIMSNGPEIGLYGSGETASGRLRHLTKEEAKELGLLSGKYRQVYTSEYLEVCLNNELH